MRILLCEPYLTGSHAAWAEGYAAHSAHDVELATMPGRFWKWRMHGAALTLAERITERPDLILASDMLPLPAFLGLARRAIGDAPVALYMHENQLTYPWREGERPDLTYAMTNWLSAAGADRVYFNSRYHLDSFFAAVPRLLNHFPDERHGQHVERVRAISEVLPVGVDLRRLDPLGERDDGPPIVLWNQRWEYDKDPETFFAALHTLSEEGLEFRVAIAGERFVSIPPVFDDARRRLGRRVVHFGYAEAAEYDALLRAAHVVVSTARQEFFGIALVEAAYAGARPLVPRRLSYPELFPDDCIYDDVVSALRQALTEPWDRARTERVRDRLRVFDWGTVAADYDARLAAVTRDVGPPPSAPPSR